MKRTVYWGIRLYLISGTSFVLGFLLLAAVALLALTSGAISCFSPGISADDAPETSAVQAAATSDAGPIPDNYLRLYQKVGREQNIPWQYLAAIGWVETRHGTAKLPGVHSGMNHAKAAGPMQFLRSSWKLYGVDGNGDGEADLYDPADAIPGAANHLRGSIGKKDPSIPLSQDDIILAIHKYNPSKTPQTNPYVALVLAAAKVYFGDDYAVAQANFEGSACSGVIGATLAGSGSFGQRIAHAAAYYAVEEGGTPTPPERFQGGPIPYSWGGGNQHGPSLGVCCSPSGRDSRRVTGFDCSGLVVYAVYKASNEKILLPRTTTTQKKSDLVVPASLEELAPGDLVFSHNDSHVGVYYGLYDDERWVVESTGIGPVQFNVLQPSQVSGVVRVKPPSGIGGEEKSFRAMAPSGAGMSEGAM